MNPTIRLTAAAIFLAPAAAWAQANLVSSKDAVFSQAATTCGGIGQAACAITVQAVPWLDLTPIVQPVLAVIGAVIAGEIAIWVPKAIAAFSARTGIILTENQRQTVLAAVDTGAGVLETALDKGAIKIEHIQIGTPAITQQAQNVIHAVPTAVAALGLSVADVSRMIVGATDTGSHGVTTATTVATAPDELVTKTTQGPGAVAFNSASPNPAIAS